MSVYKRIFQFIVSIAIISFCSSVAFTAHGKGTGSNLPEHVPNEIIVKFREPVANTVEEQLNVQTAINRLNLSLGLNELNTRYRLQKIKPLFKDFKKNRQRLKAIQQKSPTLLSKKEIVEWFALLRNYSEQTVQAILIDGILNNEFHNITFILSLVQKDDFKVVASKQAYQILYEFVSQTPAGIREWIDGKDFLMSRDVLALLSRNR